MLNWVDVSPFPYEQFCFEGTCLVSRTACPVKQTTLTGSMRQSAVHVRSWNLRKEVRQLPPTSNRASQSRPSTVRGRHFIRGRIKVELILLVDL